MAGDTPTLGPSPPDVTNNDDEDDDDDDDDDDAVLRLLEEPRLHHSAEGDDYMADSPTAGLSQDSAGSVAQHDSDFHQARAAAALQHADAAGTIPQRHDQIPPQGQQRVPAARPAPAASSLLSTPATSPQAICLCQAPARIPRPRNAFILFRQHHHATVVAQNPGKPNPEISKIIGHMWKQSPDDVKAIWQGHADEEKRQHLARYPQYRYQPRRNGKKNAAAVAAAVQTDNSSTSIEATICSNCGGRTGALSAPQMPFTRSLAAPRRTPDTAGSPGAEGVDQAGVEALLQLGGLHEEEAIHQQPIKKRKQDNASSPVLSFSQLEYASSPPNIDPYLRHTFDAAAMEASMQQLYPEQYMIKTIPVIRKVHAIASICPPISAGQRLPVVTVEGDDLHAVSQMFHALSREIRKHELVLLLDEADEFSVFDLEALLNTTSADRDTDAESASYLTHVAFWRRKATELRKAACGAPQAVVLINRYILSRSDAAAARLAADGLAPFAHWQWCTSIWKGCVGADVTICVQVVPEGGAAATDDAAVVTKESGKLIFARKVGQKEWEEKVIRRLIFEVNEASRSLRGFA